MEESEIINDMYNRFNDVVVGLKGLGKTIGKADLNRKLLLSLPKEWRPKDLTTMTMEELLGSLITHEHTLQMDEEEMETTTKKNKDLALQILMQEEDDDLDEKITLLTRNFKKFLKKEVGGSSARRQEEEDRGKEVKKNLKLKKKNTEGKIQCYKWKRFGHVMSECRTKDKDLRATLESEDESSEDFFKEFCFMAIEEERE